MNNHQKEKFILRKLGGWNMDVQLLINSTISKRENIDVGASRGKVNNIVICPQIV
jgi:hypothetical protein